MEINGNPENIANFHEVIEQQKRNVTIVFSHSTKDDLVIPTFCPAFG